MKRYITSDMPRLAQTGNFIFLKGKAKRKPVITWKHILKVRQSERVIAVKEREKPIPAEMVSWIQSLTEQGTAE